MGVARGADRAAVRDRRRPQCREQLRRPRHDRRRRPGQHAAVRTPGDPVSRRLRRLDGGRGDLSLHRRTVGAVVAAMADGRHDPHLSQAPATASTRPGHRQRRDRQRRTSASRTTCAPSRRSRSCCSSSTARWPCSRSPGAVVDQPAPVRGRGRLRGGRDRCSPSCSAARWSAQLQSVRPGESSAALAGGRCRTPSR